MCMICKVEEETVTHVLWRCIAANDIWVDNTIPVQKWSLNESEFMELWKRLSDNLTEAELKWVAAAMWRIWLRRNNFLFQDKMADPRNIIQVTDELLVLFHEAQDKR
ncbi:hypothetical protein CIPAW_14G084100 [Carya illinoinensis]|uniref:Reverse transcriptase zinc-binding domain-containing protein n=1 Tax=Carya illinoinensis TaxID=32201 RepID=A0A8T1NCK3_CARIL|nr:hypothetical protein CIPAW_14G084100 [Carya illinoinensis]